MKTLQLLSAGPRRQASARTSTESGEACQRKTKDRADGMREKVPIALDGIRTCTSGIRAHRAAEYTMKVGPAAPRISRNEHFRHSSVSSTAKQSCMKTLQLLCAGPRRLASAWTSTESEEARQRKTKDESVCVCVCVYACVRARASQKDEI